MAIPAKATGYGNNSTARNVFKIAFSQDCSQVAKYEMYDRTAAWPATGTLTTVTKKIFVGTAGQSNIPMMSLVDATSSAPASAWKPASPTAGSANPNRMKGQTNYVSSQATPTSSVPLLFNKVLEVPSDLLATEDSEMYHDLLVRYTYTGAAPTLTWSFNEGTEATPTWTTMTPGTHGIRHCKSGAGAGDYYAIIPESGTEDTVEGWVTT